ncbi:MAG: hypothetical protein JNM27_06405 [Leptospirales bacterium]|nr:hypothetical protein [Leptospirales bacterium]
MRRFLLLLVLSSSNCWANPVEVVEKTERGTIACTEMVERRRVNNYWWELSANGKPFIPPGGDSNKVGTCTISQNPAASVFVYILGESLFAFQVVAGKPTISEITGPPGLDSIQQMKKLVWSCSGDCLIWPGHLVLVKTGEVRKLPRTDLDLIGISPDLKTIVAEDSRASDVEQGLISLALIDSETGKPSKRRLSRNKHNWLLDRTRGVEGIADQFKWVRRSGKDELAYPE